MCSEVSGDGAPAGSTSVSFGGDTDMIDMVACRSIAACLEVPYASPGCPVAASLGTTAVVHVTVGSVRSGIEQ